MPNNLTNIAEDGLLDYIFGGTFQLTPPMQLALTTTLGSDIRAGNEVFGGSYARQNLVVAPSVGGSVTTIPEVVFVGMPACVVVGVEVYDSTTPNPKRLWHAPLLMARTVEMGDDFQFDAGQLTWTLS